MESLQDGYSRDAARFGPLFARLRGREFDGLRGLMLPRPGRHDRFRLSGEVGGDCGEISYTSAPGVELVRVGGK